MMEWADTEQRTQNTYEILGEMKYRITKTSKQQETTRSITTDLKCRLKIFQEILKIKMIV